MQAPCWAYTPVCAVTSRCALQNQTQWTAWEYSSKYSFKLRRAMPLKSLTYQLQYAYWQQIVSCRARSHVIFCILFYLREKQCCLLFDWFWNVLSCAIAITYVNEITARTREHQNNISTQTLTHRIQCAPFEICDLWNRWILVHLFISIHKCSTVLGRYIISPSRRPLGNWMFWILIKLLISLALFF